MVALGLQLLAGECLQVLPFVDIVCVSAVAGGIEKAGHGPIEQGQTLFRGSQQQERLSISFGIVQQFPNDAAPLAAASGLCADALTHV